VRRKESGITWLARRVGLSSVDWPTGASVHPRRTHTECAYYLAGELMGLTPSARREKGSAELRPPERLARGLHQLYTSQGTAKMAGSQCAGTRFRGAMSSRGCSFTTRFPTNLARVQAQASVGAVIRPRRLFPTNPRVFCGASRPAAYTAYFREGKDCSGKCYAAGSYGDL
jgi:hypothetical protein